MIVTTVLFVFPPELPVTGSNMNYCIVAFAIVFIISLIQWFVDGRKNYTGPKANLEESMLVAINGVDRSEMSDNGSSSLTKKGAKVWYVSHPMHYPHLHTHTHISICDDYTPRVYANHDERLHLQYNCSL